MAEMEDRLSVKWIRDEVAKLKSRQAQDWLALLGHTARLESLERRMDALEDRHRKPPASAGAPGKWTALALEESGPTTYDALQAQLAQEKAEHAEASVSFVKAARERNAARDLLADAEHTRDMALSRVEEVEHERDALIGELHEAYRRKDKSAAERDALQDKSAAERDALQAQIATSEAISDTFWDALKLLKLTAVNVSNPGSHIRELIDERDDLQGRIEAQGASIATFQAQLAALATREPSEDDHSDFLSDLREINRGHLSPESMVLPLWRFVREGLLSGATAVQEHGEDGRECPSTHQPAEAADRIAPAPAPICPHCAGRGYYNVNGAPCNHCHGKGCNPPVSPDCRYLPRWDVTCDRGTQGCGIVHDPPPPAPTEAGSEPPVMLRLRHAVTSNYMVSLNSVECDAILTELARLREKALSRVEEVESKLEGAFGRVQELEGARDYWGRAYWGLRDYLEKLMKVPPVPEEAPGAPGRCPRCHVGDEGHLCTTTMRAEP